jgi:steroid delta-isomerase-like uncharacterized protein
MSTDEEVRNKSTFMRFHDAVNSGDPELIAQAIDELVAPDVVLRTPLPVDGTGAEAFRQVWTTLGRAFPDLHIATEDLIAEDDKVVARQVVTGTHRAEYLGLAPTGRSVTYDEIFILRFEDGRVAETWGVVDVLAQMRQLGLLPA